MPHPWAISEYHLHVAEELMRELSLRADQRARRWAGPRARARMYGCVPGGVECVCVCVHVCVRACVVCVGEGEGEGVDVGEGG